MIPVERIGRGETQCPQLSVRPPGQKRWRAPFYRNGPEHTSTLPTSRWVASLEKLIPFVSDAFPSTANHARVLETCMGSRPFVNWTIDTPPAPPSLSLSLAPQPVQCPLCQVKLAHTHLRHHLTHLHSVAQDCVDKLISTVSVCVCACVIKDRPAGRKGGGVLLDTQRQLH